MRPACVFSAAAALLLLLQCAMVQAGGQCRAVPKVSGVDQSPTHPSNWGKCTSAGETAITKNSHWCGKATKSFKAWPNGPSDKAKQCLKYGRATIYRGPMYGSSPAHKAACNKVIYGSDKAAFVAVSTKYLKTWQGGWNPNNPGACGKCMCIRLHGADRGWNPGLQTANAQKHIGLTFLGQVSDRCGECPDDSVDILQDRPLSFAPYNPKMPNDNIFAPYANAKPGLRGFRDPAMLRGSATAPEAVGTWVADWQFVPCDWNHNKCAGLMKDMGYSNVFVPTQTPGIDSYTLRELGQLRVSSNRFPKPWGRDFP